MKLHNTKAVRGTCTKRDSQILTIDQSQSKKIYLLLNEGTSFNNYQSKMTLVYATFSSEVLLRLISSHPFLGLVVFLGDNDTFVMSSFAFPI